MNGTGTSAKLEVHGRVDTEAVPFTTTARSDEEQDKPNKNQEGAASLGSVFKEVLKQGHKEFEGYTASNVGWSDTQVRRTQLLDFFIILMVFIGNGIFYFAFNYEFYGEDENVLNRCSTLLYVSCFLSIVSCVFIIAKESIQQRIDRKRYKVPLNQGLMKGRGLSIVFSCLLTLLHPYPQFMGMRVEVYSAEVGMEISYHLNEILHMLAMLRVLLAGSKLMNLSVYRSASSQRVCLMYCCEADVLFALKALMKKMPITFLFLNLLAGQIYFSVLVKYCEAPVSRVVFDRQKDLNSFENCLWLVAVTLTTVGYGDLYPRTVFGRLAMFVCSFFGVVVVSVMVVGIQNTLQLSVLEEKAFTCINKYQARRNLYREAGRLISKLLIVNKNPPRGEAQLIKSLSNIKALSRQFVANVHGYRNIYDKDYTNEFRRQFDILQLNLKEFNYHLSILCRMVFCNPKLGSFRQVPVEHLSSLQMYASKADRQTTSPRGVEGREEPSDGSSSARDFRPGQGATLEDMGREPT